MIFEQYYLECLSHASYLVGDETTGRTVVVDPQRDVEGYLADADGCRVSIERVIETHPSRPARSELALTPHVGRHDRNPRPRPAHGRVLREWLPLGDRGERVARVGLPGYVRPARRVPCVVR